MLNIVIILADNIIMSTRFKKQHIMLIFMVSALILNGFLFQNCSPALFNLQKGVSAHSGEDVSSFLNDSESEIKATKVEFKKKEVYLENKDKVRNIASENDEITEVDAQLPKSNVKIQLKRKSKK